MIAVLTPTDNAVSSAIEELLYDFAAGIEASDLIVAARQPVSLAAVLDDLCRRLAIAPPPAVSDALSDAEPF
jgi:hypothetical protein